MELFVNLASPLLFSRLSRPGDDVYPPSLLGIAEKRGHVFGVWLVSDWLVFFQSYAIGPLVWLAYLVNGGVLKGP